MIRLILGGVGSGKSVRATKFIINSSKYAFGNFNVKSLNYHRLKYRDIIRYDEENKPIDVNWDFWDGARKKYGGFHIIIDEIHNVMHSRRAMSKQNIIMSTWVSQIRKVTGASEKYDLVCISQAVDRIDVAIRDIAHEIVHCIKYQSQNLIPTVIQKNGKLIKKELPKTYIMLYTFTGPGALLRYRSWLMGQAKSYDKRSYFVANPYFQYYDSYEFIKFGEGEYV